MDRRYHLVRLVYVAGLLVVPLGLDVNPLPVLAAGILGLVALAVGDGIRERRRHAELRSWAERGGHVLQAGAIGWRLDPARDLAGAPFGRGDHPRSANLVRGVHAGCAFQAFDYAYDWPEIPEGDSGRGSPRRFTVLVVELRDRYRFVEVRPAGRARQLLRAVLPQRLRRRRRRGVPANPELERRHVVRTRRLRPLPPAAVEQVLAGPPVAWRLEEARITAWQRGPLSAARADQALAFLTSVVDAVGRGDLEPAPVRRVPTAAAPEA